MVVALLRELPRVDGNPYVIVGAKEGEHITDLQKPWRRIRKAAGLADVRIHDLRHSFASGGLAVGEGLPMIGKLLGHTQVQTTARYAHLASDPVKGAADRISARLGAALLGQTSANDQGTGEEPASEHEGKAAA
jgi:integrase